MDDQLHSLRHSAAHIMAQAVMDILPGTKLGFGPAIEDGFYSVSYTHLTLPTIYSV